jgi:hypothetical protein
MVRGKESSIPGCQTFSPVIIVVSKHDCHHHLRLGIELETKQRIWLAALFASYPVFLGGKLRGVKD